jgi:hypothetical protein
VVVAEDCTELLLVALRVAVLAYAAQFDVEVPLATCTVAVAPDDRFPKLQLNVWLAMEHVPGPVYVGLMLQLMPVPDGNVSLRVADVAIPLPVLLAAKV